MSPEGPLLRFERPLQAATFVRRPHRFSTVCVLEANGVEVESHLADPGRLVEILVPDARLFVDGPFPPPRKLAYSTVLAEQDGTLVSLVSSMPNKVFEALLTGGHLPGLATPQDIVAIKREVKRGKSRFDFEVTTRSGPVLVECKGVGLRVGDAGMFPDAPSARALKHVEELREYVLEGGRAAVVFIAGRDDVTSFAPARHIDPAFADGLLRAVEAGVEVFAHSLKVERDGVFAGRGLEVEVS